MVNLSRHAALAVTLGLAAACQPAQVRYAPQPEVQRDASAGDATLFLLGDGGLDTQGRRDVLQHLTANVEAAAIDARRPVTVVFMGDNVYDDGIREAFTDIDSEKLRGQVEAVPALPNVRGVFVPGNHDWANGREDPEGRAAMLRQAEAIRTLAGDRNVVLLPDDACPGPVAEDFGTSARLVYFDSEWLLRRPADQCGPAEDFFARLRDELAAHPHRRSIVISHHPLVTGGPHGGNVAPLQRGPLVYYLAVKAGASIQDRGSRAYAAMAHDLERVFAESGAPPFIQAAGHDHNQQVIRLLDPEGSAFQIVSGSAAKTTRVRRVDGMRFGSDGYGYVRLDFHGRAVQVSVYERPTAQGQAPVRKVFACSLAAEDTISECAEAPLLAEEDAR